MKKPQCGRGPSGFTLIEMLVVMVLMIALLLFAVPAFQTYVRQGKLWGVANQTKTLMQLARLEAVRRTCPTIIRIVEEDPLKGDPAQVEGFVDCDGDGVADADMPPTLGSFPLPSGVFLLAPPDREGADSVGKLSPDPAGGDAKVAIFLPRGEIDEIGGFRFGDDRGNFLEVWVEPMASGRPEIYKCRVCTDAENRADWYAGGAGGEAWIWK
jgi:type II secretory pathway pseudopilin PulG